jgi:hypothetical protein
MIACRASVIWLVRSGPLVADVCEYRPVVGSPADIGSDLAMNACTSVVALARSG